MHLAPANRRRAFRKLITLLKPGGWLAISFRQPDPSDPRAMFPCHVDELEQLARIHGSFIERCETANDEFSRSGIQWTRMVVRLPDDGTGALPVIRHIILKDSKSSTYKLALLRVLARIAEGSLGLTRSVDDEYVAVPFGLVAVFWLRQFKPVLQVGLPQMPTNVGLDGLGFVKGCIPKDHSPFPPRFSGGCALYRTRRLVCSSGHQGCRFKHQGDAGEIYIVPDRAAGVRGNVRAKSSFGSRIGPSVLSPK
jgi:hypothetical protein